MKWLLLACGIIAHATLLGVVDHGAADAPPIAELSADLVGPDHRAGSVSAALLAAGFEVREVDDRVVWLRYRGSPDEARARLEEVGLLWPFQLRWIDRDGGETTQSFIDSSRLVADPDGIRSVLAGDLWFFHRPPVGLGVGGAPIARGHFDGQTLWFENEPEVWALLRGAYALVEPNGQVWGRPLGVSRRDITDIRELDDRVELTPTAAARDKLRETFAAPVSAVLVDGAARRVPGELERAAIRFDRGDPDLERAAQRGMIEIRGIVEIPDDRAATAGPLGRALSIALAFD